LAFLEEAEIVQITRDEEHTETTFRKNGQALAQVPPPWHTVDKLAAEILRAESLLRRLAWWWSRFRGGVVPAGQEGKLSVSLGILRTELAYEILWHPCGMLIGLGLRPSAELHAQAAIVAKGYQPRQSE
jgi:hypothetical protein